MNRFFLSKCQYQWLFMVNPTLWGPATWQFLFSCAWHCKRKDIPALHYLVFVLTPRILPCVKCREHHISNHKRVIRRLGSSYETGHDIFRYLWHLKDEVNRSMGCKSIKIDDLTERPSPWYVRSADTIETSLSLVATSLRSTG